MMRKYFVSLLSLCLWGLSQTVSAEGETFTVCALNVDGLPKKILTIDVNPDGPGSEGTRLISSYLAGKNYDLIGLSEDFNYHSSLLSCLENYNSGTWRGAIDFGSIAPGLFDNQQLDTDGLGFLWKEGYTVGQERWVAWEHTHGKFADGFDENVKKGYRYYSVTLPGGSQIDVYVLHMDAETGAEDNSARETQIVQLADEIISNKNGRPKLVIGDTNCRYTRDPLKTKFIDAINTQSLYSIKDVWVEYMRNGSYPTYGGAALTNTSQGHNSPNNEVVDKIFVLNPAYGIQLSLKEMRLDEDYVNEAGEMLGDHYPLVATFEVKGSDTRPTEAKDFWLGEKELPSGARRYLYNVGSGLFLHQDGTLVASADNASVWSLWGDGDQRTISTDDGYRLVLDYNLKRFTYRCYTQTGSGATTFSLTAGWSRGDAYKFKASSHYVNVEWNDNYSLDAGAGYESDLSDWLLISEQQKLTYENYVNAFNDASIYADWVLPIQYTDRLKTAISTPVNYSNAQTVTNEIRSVITSIREFLASCGKEKEVTGRIKNPSFENISIVKKLGETENGENYNVYGWTVSQPGEADEAFTPWENEQNGNGRYFTGMDGSHIFNAWSGGGYGTFYCKQEITIQQDGCYVLSAVVASGGDPEGDTQVRLFFGGVSQRSGTLTDRTQGVPLQLYTYCKKGKYVIGIESNQWFKADNFQLFQLTEPRAVKGDINGDGIVTLADVTLLLDVYLGKVAPLSNIDVTGNGIFDLSDIIAAVNLYLKANK